MSLKQKAQALKVEILAVFLALKDRRTPWYAKAVCAVAVAYALSPIDLVPDFIPVLGYLDDVLLLPGLLALAIRWVPQEVMEQCRQAAKSIWQQGRPRMWYGAVLVGVVWLALAIVLLKIIF